MTRKKPQTGTTNRFPAGYSDERVRAIIHHYESQTPEQALQEDESTLAAAGQTLMVVPIDLVGEVAMLIASHHSRGAKPPRKTA